MPNKDKQNPLVYLFQKTWRYSEGNHKNVVYFWIMFIVANTIKLIAEPLIWAAIINHITLEGIVAGNIKVLVGLLLATLLAEIVFWALHGPARVLERVNAFKARAKYREYLVGGVMALPMEWQVDHHSGDTIDKIEKGTSALYNFAEDSFETISSIVKLFVSFAMLAYFSSSSSVIVLAMMAVTVWITMRFDRVLVGQYKELNWAENHVAQSVFDSISNITTVIILRVERLVLKAIVKSINISFALFKRNNQLNELKWFATSICAKVMTILVLGVYLYQHLGTAKGVLVGSVFLLINYLGKISDLFFQFTGMYGDILQRRAKVANAEELADEFVAGSLLNHVLPNDWQTLDISGLNFSYYGKGGGDQHLTDAAISIRRGQNIAFVGQTGSGKTTFLNVMRGLYQPQGLVLAVDGKAIAGGFEDICQAMSLVPQDPEIFATTILNNITLGATPSLELIRVYTEMACFADVVEKLPRGFDTSMREKGVNLSGGQKQRLALARGLLACDDKDIVLLDEPTSSLDSATERQVYENIFTGFSGKTIISTVHRLHLLPLFDRVCLFSEGRIIASGTLDELLLSSHEFQDLWQKGLLAESTTPTPFA